jgi:hypothetical protein
LTLDQAPAPAAAGPAGPNDDPAPSPAFRRPARWLDWLLVGVVGAGIGLRIWSWFTAATLANDDIALLYSVRGLPFSKLFGMLILNQGAPTGWLLAERGVVDVAGASDRVVRFIPLIFACLALVTIAWLARTTISRIGAIAAVALLSWSVIAVQYSWQAKPYSADMAAAAAVLAVAVWSLRRPRWTLRDGLVMWITASAAAVISFPSLFVTVTSALVLVLDRLLARRTEPASGLAARVRGWLRESVPFCVPSVIWLATVAGLYLTQLRYLRGSQNNHPMWVGAFGPKDGSPIDQAVWSWRILEELVTTLFHTPVAWLVVLLLPIGAVLLALRDRAVAALVTAPLVAALLLGIVQAYPLRERLALWLFPSLVLLLSAGLGGFPGVGRFAGAGRFAGLAGGRGTYLRLAGGAAVVALLAATVLVPSIRSVVDTGAGKYPPTSSNADRIVPAMDAIAARDRPGDIILTESSLYHRAYWYGHARGLPAPAGGLTATPECKTDLLAVTVGDAPRVWLVAGQPWVWTDPSVDELTLAWLRADGAKVTEVHRDGRVRVYLAERQPGKRAVPRPGGLLCVKPGVLPRWLDGAYNR